MLAGLWIHWGFPLGECGNTWKEANMPNCRPNVLLEPKKKNGNYFSCHLHVSLKGAWWKIAIWTAKGGQKRARLPRLILNTKNVLVMFAGRLRTQGDTDTTFSIHWKKKKKIWQNQLQSFYYNLWRCSKLWLCNYQTHKHFLWGQLIPSNHVCVYLCPLLI